MKQQYKKLLALIALAIVGAKSRAAIGSVPANDTTCASIHEAYGEVLAKPDVNAALLDRSKAEIEEAFQQTLSDQEFSCVVKLLAELNEYAPVNLKRPTEMVLGSQEVWGGR